MENVAPGLMVIVPAFVKCAALASDVLPAPVMLTVEPSRALNVMPLIELAFQVKVPETLTVPLPDNEEKLSLLTFEMSRSAPAEITIGPPKNADPVPLIEAVAPLKVCVPPKAN